jgi:hypothetical protein
MIQLGFWAPSRLNMMGKSMADTLATTVLAAVHAPTAAAAGCANTSAPAIAASTVSPCVIGRLAVPRNAFTSRIRFMSPLPAWVGAVCVGDPPATQIPHFHSMAGAGVFHARKGFNPSIWG